MTEELRGVVPNATAPLPVGTLEAHMTEVREWLLGSVKDNKSQPGLIAMVTEMWEEAKIRRERREAFGRAVASGSVIAIFIASMTYVKEHWR